jgi:O-antigen/teichoic acid export membrane protein
MVPVMGQAGAPVLHDGRGLFLFNVSSNMAYIAITTSAMLIYIPYVVGHLGAEGYGIVSLVNLAALFALCLGDGLGTALSRNLAIDLGTGNHASARRTFSSGLVLSGVLIALCIAPAALLCGLCPTLFQVAPHLAWNSQLYAAAAMLQVFITFIEHNFASSAVVMHRFDLRNAVRLLTVATRMAVVVVCFSLTSAQVWHVGLGLAVAALVSLAGNMLLWRSLTPGLTFSLAAVAARRMRGITGTGLPVTFNRIGWVILIGSDLVVINWFFDPVATGHFGVLMLLAELMRNGVDAASSVLCPGILVQYARGKFASLADMMRRSVKLLSLALAIAVGVLCALGGHLLEQWLGPAFRGLELPLAVVCGHFAMTLGAAPLSHVLTAYDKVGALSAWTFALGIVNLALAAAMAKWSGLGPIGAVAATGAMLMLRTLLLVLYAARALQVPAATYLTSLLQAVLVTIGVGLLTHLLAEWHQPAGWLDLACSALVAGGLSLGLVFAFFLDRSDRILLFRLLPLRMRSRLRRRGFARSGAYRRHTLAEARP